MTLNYNLPTQTVSLEMTPAEFAELTDLARTRIKDLFTALVAQLHAASGTKHAEVLT